MLLSQGCVVLLGGCCGQEASPRAPPGISNHPPPPPLHGQGLRSQQELLQQELPGELLLFLRLLLGVGCFGGFRAAAETLAQAGELLGLLWLLIAPGPLLPSAHGGKARQSCPGCPLASQESPGEQHPALVTAGTLWEVLGGLALGISWVLRGGSLGASSSSQCCFSQLEEVERGEETFRASPWKHLPCQGLGSSCGKGSAAACPCLALCQAELCSGLLGADSSRALVLGKGRGCAAGGAVGEGCWRCGAGSAHLGGQERVQRTPGEQGTGHGCCLPIPVPAGKAEEVLGKLW